MLYKRLGFKDRYQGHETRAKTVLPNFNSDAYDMAITRPIGLESQCSMQTVEKLP